ncbi:cation-translocating P-type ATPase [Candidatus Peregrinibacteria bacterium]|nr:cation-translocating P-type ATPase [Candidatus Peregrinibacteria bacterium]
MDHPATTHIQDLFKTLDSNEKGLSDKEAAERLRRYGRNEILETAKVTLFQIFLRQYKNVMVIILLIGMAISFLLGETLDATAILAIVILNALIGFIQEYKAEKTIAAMKKLAAPYSIVIRDKESKKIPAGELVPGDILILEEGMSIGADARIINATELNSIEAAITGESQPVPKNAGILKKIGGLGDMANMVFMGTQVSKGHGLALVVNTGMKSEFGKIAALVQTVEDEMTPLQVKLDKLSKHLAVLVVCMILFLFGFGALTGKNMIEMLLLSISLAVSVIPEGLPAVVTLTLAIGVQQLAKRNAIVRRLASTETLGSTSVICTDKTGTLTQNQMTVRSLFISGKEITVSGRGYEPVGRFSAKTKDLQMLLNISVLCNNSRLLREDGQWTITGDPTEACLLTLAGKGGMRAETVNKKYPRISEMVFDSERKRMSTINKMGSKILLLCKGAPDSILKVSDKVLLDGRVVKLSPEMKEKFIKMNEEYAAAALRVLCFAYKEIGNHEKPSEKNLILVGLAGMMDPPRLDAKESVQKCHEAGIKVVMITGDHALTAKAVAEEIGIIENDGDLIVTGEELKTMSAKQLRGIIDRVKIFARVNPSDKVQILNAFKSKGRIVAMTGDGINDAPALRRADIGVAMGITGTDVAKEAGDMVLADDNFATIVASVEMGRVIYANIKRFIRFLLSTNFDEILVISVVFLLGMPIPLLPLQILWINLLTDTFPALALGVDTQEKGIMKQAPRNPNKSIFQEMIGTSLLAGFVSALIGFIIFVTTYWSDGIDKARTSYFTTVVVFELLFAYSVRYEDKHYFTNFFGNKFLTLSVLFSILLQLFVVYSEPAQKIFKTVPLAFEDWSRIIIFSIMGIAAMETWKLIKRNVHSN